MPVGLKYVTIDMYADDTLVYMCGKDPNEIANSLNDDLKALNTWFKDNLMKVNADKTKVMFLGTPQNQTN